MRQLRQIRRLAVWNGIEGYMPDDRPVMRASDRVSGLHCAYGFSGQAFQLGPAVGDVMAELIDTGATSTPLRGFGMSRFRSGADAISEVLRHAARDYHRWPMSKHPTDLAAIDAFISAMRPAYSSGLKWEVFHWHSGVYPQPQDEECSCTTFQ